MISKFGGRGTPRPCRRARIHFCAAATPCLCFIGSGRPQPACPIAWRCTSPATPALLPRGSCSRFAGVSMQRAAGADSSPSRPGLPHPDSAPCPDTSSYSGDGWVCCGAHVWETATRGIWPTPGPEAEGRVTGAAGGRQRGWVPGAKTTACGGRDGTWRVPGDGRCVPRAARGGLGRGLRDDDRGDSAPRARVGGPRLGIRASAFPDLGAQFRAVRRRGARRRLAPPVGGAPRLVVGRGVPERDDGRRAVGRGRRRMLDRAHRGLAQLLLHRPPPRCLHRAAPLPPSPLPSHPPPLVPPPPAPPPPAAHARGAPPGSHFLLSAARAAPPARRRRPGPAPRGAGTPTPPPP